MVSIQKFFFKYYILLFLILFFIMYVILLNIYINNINKFNIMVSKNDKDFQSFVDYNFKNIDNISKIFKLKLSEKISLLLDKKQSFNEWVKTNNIIIIDNHKYYFLIYEKVQNSDNAYICRYSMNENYIDISHDDIMKDQMDNVITKKYDIDIKLVDNMFNLGNDKYMGNIDYYWLDTYVNKMAKKKCFIYHIQNLQIKMEEK